MKRFTLFAIISLFTVASYAQILKVTTTTGDDLTNDTMYIEGVSPTLEDGLYVENVSGVTRDIQLKRYEVNVIGSTGNYFCWGDCYEEVEAGVFPVWEALAAIPLDPDEVETSTRVYYVHKNIPGPSTFLYVYYDVNSPDDSVTVTVIFNAPEYVGVKELTASDVSLKASPNPATDKFTISYELANYHGGNASIAVIDLLGKKQGEYRINNQSGRVEVDAADYVPGIYFYSLQVNGTLIETKKLIVN